MSIYVSTLNYNSPDKYVATLSINSCSITKEFASELQPINDLMIQIGEIAQSVLDGRFKQSSIAEDFKNLFKNQCGRNSKRVFRRSQMVKNEAIVLDCYGAIHKKYFEINQTMFFETQKKFHQRLRNIGHLTSRLLKNEQSRQNSNRVIKGCLYLSIGLCLFGTLTRSGKPILNGIVLGIATFSVAFFKAVYRSLTGSSKKEARNILTELKGLKEDFTSISGTNTRLYPTIHPNPILPSQNYPINPNYYYPYPSGPHVLSNQTNSINSYPYSPYPQPNDLSPALNPQFNMPIPSAPLTNNTTFPSILPANVNPTTSHPVYDYPRSTHALNSAESKACQMGAGKYSGHDKDN